MPDVRMALSIRQAMARASAPPPEAAPEAAPGPAGRARPAPEPEGSPPPRSLVRRLFGWLRPPIDYGRRLLAAPVLARQDEARALADLRFAHLAADLQALKAQQADLLNRAAGDAATLLRVLADQADRLGARHAALESALGDIATRQAAQAGELAGQAGELAALAARQEATLGILGPRFDELEIKVRPLVAFDDESYAVRLADGYAMVPRAEPTFALMVVNAPSGGLEAGTRRVLQALIQPGMTVADVGANVGLLTLACARATGPEGRVHAFEPEPGPRAQLEKTLAINGLAWVESHAQAAGRARGRLAFHVSPIIGHSSLYALPAAEAAAARRIEVEVVTLDEAVALDRPLEVVKIDVEGAELDVLAGMEKHLAASRDIALVAEFGPSHLQRVGIDPEAWWAAFRRHGFSAFAIQEPTGVCAPVTLKAALKAESVNIAFVRKGGRAHARLPRA